MPETVCSTSHSWSFCVEVLVWSISLGTEILMEEREWGTRILNSFSAPFLISPQASIGQLIVLFTYVVSKDVAVTIDWDFPVLSWLRFLSSRRFLSPAHPHLLCETQLLQHPRPCLLLPASFFPSVFQLCKPTPSSLSYCLCRINPNSPMLLPHERLSSLWLPQSFSSGLLRLEILSQVAFAGTVLYILGCSAISHPYSVKDQLAPPSG